MTDNGMACAEMDSLREELWPILEGYSSDIVLSVLTGHQMEVMMQTRGLGPNAAMGVMAKTHAQLVGVFPEDAEKT